MRDEIESYAAQLLAETREEVARADSKAEILFAAFGIVVAAVLGGLVTRGWSPTWCSGSAAAVPPHPS
jgi:hypothetical protein